MHAAYWFGYNVTRSARVAILNYIFVMQIMFIEYWITKKTCWCGPNMSYITKLN